MAAADQHKALAVIAAGGVETNQRESMSQRRDPDPYQSPCAYEIRDGRVKAVKR